MLSFRTTSEEETAALGRRLAALLAPGDVLLLCGPLGSGKTRFAAGVGAGLGVEEPLTSPSFVIVHTHDGFIPVVHADVYRLNSTSEFDDLDLIEEARGAVLLVEWGDVIERSIAEDHLSIRFDVVSESERQISLEPNGAWMRRDLKELLV